MLLSLSLRNIVLIEALDLDFAPGLTVLTGETGAGKSILLDALGFSLGARVRRDLVRAGAAQGSVAATFAVQGDHPVRAVLDDLGLDQGDELVLRRAATPDGPARGFVNDQRVGAEALARIGAALVEVHGQHDDRGLLNPRAHRPMLDLYAGTDAQGSQVRAAWAAAEAATRALAEAEARRAQATVDADYLRHAAAELARLAPQPGEDAALDAERRRVQSAQRIVEEVAKAATQLSGPAETAMADALNRLTHVGGQAEGRLDPAIAALDRALIELSEAQSGVAAVLDALRFDDSRIDAVEERLFAIRAAARKHQVPPDDLAELARDLAGRLDDIEAGEGRIAELTAADRAARDAYTAAAAGLTATRQAAAARLDREVTAELGPLRMEAARFATRVTPGRPGPDGADDVAFTAAINPGTPPGPIDRIASGGELSRFLLAIKVCLAARAPGVTMIFDEIDRGVGGATADAVGRRLQRLAAGGQVLVVTHSPQVAARGAQHWRIAKSTDGVVTRTDVTPLAPPDRVDEIARMLAGDQVTAEARGAARALIGQAGAAA